MVAQTKPVPEVSVLLITYNQEEYVAQALDSFLMQETSFPFEILVNDDCSTDGTTEVLLEYERRHPEKITVVTHDENQYSQGRMPIASFLMPIARGRYVAMCEGDDYWTCPHKLQRQYDVMSANPALTACVHASENVQASTGRRISAKHFMDHDGNVDLADMLDVVQCFATNSLFIRADAMRTYITSDIVKTPADGDHKLNLFFAATDGGMYYLDTEMSAYRFLAKNSINRRMLMGGDLDALARKNHDGRVELLRAIDAYTHGAYHEQVLHGIDSMDYAYHRDIRDYRGLKRRWPERFRRESLPARADAFLYTYVRPLHRLLFGIYCRL